MREDVLANHGEQEHAGKAELTSQTAAVNRKQLYQGYYRREMSHDPTTHIITYYRSRSVWSFIGHIYLAPGRGTQAQRV